MNYTRPFLKWPGGKFRLLPHITPLLPPKKVLVEPFVGAGAVFLNHTYEQYWLNDINADLINLYRIIKRQGRSFIPKAQKWFHAKNNKPERYYAFRKRFNMSQDLEEKAYLFLLLNRLGYNGLCRYNQKGEYNVPFGRYKHPYFPEKEIERYLKMASRVRLFNKDYTDIMHKVRSLGEDAVTYCDPPYAPLSKTASFTHYANKPFPLQYQEDLGKEALLTAKAGGCVLVSNHDLPFTRKLYQHAHIVPLKVQRVISCKAKQRKKVKELIAVFDGI